MKQAPSYSNQRVGIFVDVQNLYHSAKNLHQARVNYAELMKHLVAGRQLIRAMAYVVKSEGIEPQRPMGEGARGRGRISTAPSSAIAHASREENSNGGLSSE